MKEKIKNILEGLNGIGEMSECEISEILKKDGINIVFYLYYKRKPLPLGSG